MSLRKPKHDNFSKWGFKIDRLNQARNQKNIQTIINCINRQEKDYKLTDFDIFLYHIYSKPISQCLKQPDEKVDQNSPLSVQEQNIVYQQMNKYLSHLKELRQEFQNDKQLSIKTRLRRFSQASDDQISDSESLKYSQNLYKNQKQYFNNKLLRFTNEGSNSLNESQRLKNNSLYESKDNFDAKRNKIDIKNIQKIANKRSKTQEENYYSDEQSDISSYRQGFTKNQRQDTLKSNKQQFNQKKVNFFYGTQVEMQKANNEEKVLMEDIEELKNKNQYKLKQVELLNEQKADYSPSPKMQIQVKQNKSIIDNMNNLQYYNKIIPQNASLTRSNVITNQILRDAHKKQNIRLKRQPILQVKEISPNKIQIENKKDVEQQASINSIPVKKEEDYIKLSQSGIGVNNRSPNNKMAIKEKASQILSDFNLKLIEMDYQLKKSRAFINQEDDSDLEDTQTFQKRLQKEQNKNHQQQIEKNIKERQLQLLNDENSKNVSIEEGLSPKNVSTSKLEVMKMQKCSVNSALFEARQLKCRSSSPQKNEMLKIFNQSLSNSISGSQLLQLNEQKQYNNQNQIHIENQQIIIPQLNKTKNNSSFSILSPNARQSSSFSITQEGLKSQNQEQRARDNNNFALQTPKQIKPIQESPKSQHKQNATIQSDHKTPHNENKQKICLNSQNLPNTIKFIKPNKIPTPSTEKDILSKSIIFNDQICVYKDNKITQVQVYNQSLSDSPYSQQQIINSGKYQQINQFDSPTQNKITNQTNVYDQKGKKVKNELLNFSNQYEMLQPITFSEKKVRNTSLSPVLKFNSNQKKNQDQQLYENLAKLNSIMSEEKLSQSIFSDIVQRNYQSPFKNENNEKNQGEEGKKRVLPKINITKFKNETSLLNKMEDMRLQAQHIKKQFLKISKQFKEEFICNQADNEESTEESNLQTSQQKIFIDLKQNDISKKHQKQQTNMKESQDSINLNFYLEVQEKRISEKKRHIQESQIQNIQAYHLYHNSKTPSF